MKSPAGIAAITAAATGSAKHSLAFLLAAAPHRHSGRFFHLLASFGVFGIFLVSIVDSSFVPLPVPGVTDIMLVIFAAQKSNWILLVLLATAGSALGGYLSYQVGHAGGMQFLEKHVPARIFKNITAWMEKHAFLAIALPAVLPPPMPLSPFVLAAGALKMSRKKFLTIFTLSRGARHAFTVWLGIHYGKHVLHLWSHFSAKWATPILIVIWTAILIGCAIAFWKIYKTSKSVGSHSAGLPDQSETAI
ncbi:MAG TPA: VTT domain-containing protein [Edaphobacter sp.]|uniref:YqaA family protein n=1 Tax=Edaphobacter sp. TaxID=1934404 RepID=UPI002C176AAD|nr:VTT domain-containing protein [Edaphobacter sp.]HUZ93665.1 VTT domain-containing protein [Edaphobacter sp.]